MRGVVVALDLETTGLDVSSANIIEIGAVKFDGQNIVDIYSTLVNPGAGVNIPQKVSAITGITAEKLVGAPKLNDVLPRVRAFVGSAPVVGHNVDFDMRFLQKAGILADTLSIDTYEMASVLLPTASRYNLNALMQELNLPPDGDYHRALADAKATIQVYAALWHKLMHELPLDLLHEIVAAAQRLPWKGLPPFADALQARLDAGEKLVDSPTVAGFTPPGESRPPRQPAGMITPLEGARLAAQLGANSEIAQVVPDYAPRAPQADMLEAVAAAFNNNEHLLVEAMPGTGRSLAYLLPAVTWAMRNGERVVISVNTDSLKKQLLDKDILMLSEALGMDIQAVSLQDRTEYLCPRRLQTLRRRLPTSVEELRVFAKVQVWLFRPGLESGERVSLRGPAEYSTWARLSAADEQCTTELCEARMQRVCPFFKAHRAAESAHLVVVNHALLLADAASDSPVIPDYRRLIVDEAHNLEEATTDSLGTRLDATTIKRQLADLGTTKSGLLGDVLTSTQAVLPANLYERVRDYVRLIVKAVKDMDHHVDDLFAAVLAFLETTGNIHSGEYMVQVRLSMDLRHKAAFSQVKAAWDVLSEFTSAIADVMTRLANSLPNLRGRYEVANLEDLIDGVSAAARHLTSLHQRLNSFITTPDSNTIYWAEVSPDLETIGLRAAPLHIAPLVKRYLWDAKQTVVMTSATFRAGGSFQFLRERLGADDLQEVAIPSRFDYTQSTLVFLPTDMPEPQERGKYQQFVERGIIELASATNGRLMALFTGYTQLRQVAQNIAPRLALGNITVFDQSDGTSREMLLEGFRSAEKAVLLGTRSFWEDVDLPDDSLVALVIVRLPFAVPSDPVYAARGETFENSFDQFTVPDAILRFRQGFDRLIRARKSRSVVTVFDRRMTSKSYGQNFLESLPAVTVQRASMSDLAAAAKAWLNEDK